MPIEVEQKFSLPDSKRVLAKLIELGAESRLVVRQVDTYYAHPVRDFATTDEALRIRQVGEANFITYKGPKLDLRTKTRREIELPLAAGHQAAADYGELLDALGFEPVATVRKIRQILQVTRAGQTIEVALDQVDSVGTFIELEIVVTQDDQVDQAQQQIHGLASDLQLDQPVRSSYLELLLGE
jgi:adenylate cyclase class 2